jgi:hypothetical protein
MAEEALRTRILAPSADFSPAEAFAGLADSLALYQASGALPRELEVKHPLGPAAMSEEAGAEGLIPLTDVIALAIQAGGEIGRTGALPSIIPVGPRRLGPGRIFALMAAAYLDLAAGRAPAGYDFAPFEPYPRTNEKPALDLIQGYKSWPVHRPDLDMARILEYTKLQLWTLKPAHLR